MRIYIEVKLESNFQKLITNLTLFTDISLYFGSLSFCNHFSVHFLLRNKVIFHNFFVAEKKAKTCDKTLLNFFNNQIVIKNATCKICVVNAYYLRFVLFLSKSNILFKYIFYSTPPRIYFSKFRKK